jgi:hypothetical protein
MKITQAAAKAWAEASKKQTKPKPLNPQVKKDTK